MHSTVFFERTNENRRRALKPNGGLTDQSDCYEKAAVRSTD